MSDIQLPPAGWHDDPYRRFSKRYWDGARWSDWVSNGATTESDPVVGPYGSFAGSSSNVPSGATTVATSLPYSLQGQVGLVSRPSAGLAWSAALLGIQAGNLLLFGVIMMVGGTRINNSTFRDLGNQIALIGFVLTLAGVGCLMSSIGCGLRRSWSRVLGNVMQIGFILLMLVGMVNSSSGNGGGIIVVILPVIILILLNHSTTKEALKSLP